MKKLKDLLKESFVWERQFGEKLPSLKDCEQRFTTKQEGKLTEVNFEKVKVPSQVKRFLVKFVDSVKGAGLNRIKRSAVLYQVIDAMGMSPQQLVKDIQKIKKELGEGKLNEDWQKNFPGFSSKEYDVIQNWIDMGSLPQTISMYKKNKKSFTQFIKDAA